MIVERIIFNVLAFTLFVFMFAKMISKNDTNYIAIIALQALGIAVSFFETNIMDRNKNINICFINFSTNIGIIFGF